MKLALIRQRYTDYGGAELYVRRLSARLLERGHEVHVLARKWEARESEGLVFHRISSPGGPTFIRQPGFARAVARKVSESSFDLVHSFDRTYSQDIYRAGDGCHCEWLARRAAALGRLRGFIDSVNPRHKAFLDLESRLFSDSRLKIVLVNSKQGREEIIRHYGVDENKVRVLYNGLDKKRFHSGLAEEYRGETRRELGIDEDEPVALFVGSGFQRKGLGELIASLPHCGVKLLVAGRDDQGPYIRLAKQKGVIDRVVFLGPRTDVVRLLGAADVFVLPSWYEPFSNACLEAMAAGLPTVTTMGTGAAEVIEEGINGYTASFPVEPEELAEKMELAIKIDQSGLITANEKILEPFDWDLNVDQTLAAYEEILGYPLS